MPHFFKNSSNVERSGLGGGSLCVGAFLCLRLPLWWIRDKILLIVKSDRGFPPENGGEMRELTEREVEDLLVGCAILGTGGGGDLEEGLKLVRGALGAGRGVRLAALGELDPGSWIGSPYYCGAVSPQGEGIEGRVALWAFEVLEEFLGRPFAGVIAAELGGLATAGAIAVAAEKGLPLLDADALGRAAPELQCSYFYVKGIPIAPMGLATPQGDLILIREIQGDARAEEVVRTLATRSGGMVGVCDHPAQVERLQGSCIEGTLSRALQVGMARRQAVARGDDPTQAVAAAGFLLFTGKVEKHSFRVEGGFTLGEIVLAGEGDFSGRSYKIHYKNEHLISWLDGEVDVTVPDLICVLDRETGMPITNPNCQEGQRVAVVGFPAPKEWRTPEGLRVLGPAFFGYEVEYVPLEGRRG